jgi:hypothetical protein
LSVYDAIFVRQGFTDPQMNSVGIRSYDLQR